MAKKGKEINFGGYRIQIDPLVLATRVVMRQKLTLGIVALIGGLLTIVVYLKTPKQYDARSNTLIRYENFAQDYLQRLLNVAVGYLGSDTEMSSIINELDLYGNTRARQPYEMALRRLRTELNIKASPRNIEVSFRSRNPQESQRVVAYATERLLNLMAELTEQPYDRKLEALDRELEATKPKSRAALAKVLEFKAAHPEITVQVADYLPDASGGRGGVEGEIRQAEKDLANALTGRIEPRAAVVEGVKQPRDTARFRALKEREAELNDLRQRNTDTHPDVQRLERVVAELREAVRKENLEADGIQTPSAPAGASPEELQARRVAAARSRLQDLLEKKKQQTVTAGMKPKLQQEWADISFNSSTLSSNVRTMVEQMQKVRSDRLVAANDFQQNFQLVDAVRVPEIPSEPSRGKYMFVGMMVTAILGMAIAVGREAFRQTYANANEFEEQSGLVVFAVLPSIRKEI